MNTREWALLIFTILGQMAAGMMLVLMIVQTYAVRKVGAEQAARLTDVPFYLVLPIMGVAMLASLLHLGKLIHVIGAVPNLATSWMSREVVFAVTFIVLVAVYVFLQWRRTGSEMLQTVIGWVTTLIGLIFVFCMGMTYMLPAQPAWNTWATSVTFFVTSLLLGALGSAAAIMVNYARLPKEEAGQQDFLGNVLQSVSVSAIILLGLEFLVLPMYFAYLSTQGSAALQTLNLIIGTYGATLIIRLILVFAGAGVLGAYLYRNASLPGKEKSWAILAYSAFVLVLVSEVMGRFVFYATHFRIGI
jgi:anaerobic dimethyl sulfoxide reductase subunit C (anchor subunit)